MPGSLATLSRFLSKSGDRNLPFFKNLRRASSTKFYWDDECHKAFEELKEYSGSPKLLSQLEPWDMLHLYLDVSNRAISSVLICEVEGQQRLVYYESRVLHGGEENYLVIDKFAFTLLISVQKLKIYIESCPIQVLTDQPMKRVIISPQLSRRLITWAIEISELEIFYVPRTSIKAQALADFVIEFTAQTPQIVSGSSDIEPGTNNPEWILFVDGARNEKGSGAGILMDWP
ncbi:hypothetical protein LIER_42884 [Lithospermum erythrorhizon]|uniref:Reverse transcriptase/retrotransposon-derived protein RNase H-like domain-containing protein n=1 Tax=Lithospermum erythrorhizon TaxID=34254 RepID=A0AAV3P439_LITER